MTKYNAEDVNRISSLTSDGSIDDDASRSESRKNSKMDHDAKRLYGRGVTVVLLGVVV